MKTAHQKVDHNLQCPTCGKTSANRNALYKHISAVHNYTVHKCNMCGKEFKQGVALKVDPRWQLFAFNFCLIGVFYLVF